MLTLDEVKTVNQLKPKQTDILMGILEKMPEDIKRREFSRFKIEKDSKYGSVSFAFAISNDNGLLRDRFHIIISKNGKIKQATSNYGSGETDYVDEFKTVRKTKVMINYFMEDIASWKN